MKVAEISLDNTLVKFYNDFTANSVKNLNQEYFENIFGVMLKNILLTKQF